MGTGMMAIHYLISVQHNNVNTKYVKEPDKCNFDSLVQGVVRSLWIYINFFITDKISVYLSNTYTKALNMLNILNTIASC